MGTINTKLIIVTTSVSAFMLNAMEVDLTVGSDLIYSDNINLSKNKDDGFVNTLSFGASVNETDLIFAYDLYRTLHYNHDKNNDFFQELNFDYNKNLHKKKINISTNAVITNVSTSFNDFVGNDFISDKTVETRTLNGDISYRNNLGDFFTLKSNLSGTLVSNEDNIGNFHTVGAGINLASKGSHLLWLTDYNYSRTFYNGVSTIASQHNLQQRLGYDLTERFNLSAAFYYDAVEQSDAVGRTSQFSWGPLLHYKLKNQSYLELGYQFTANDEDFWNGAFVLNPTKRTQFAFDFTRRFYGDAYNFSLSHKLDKFTNLIRYSEEITNFDREFFIDGAAVNSFQLEKGWTYESSIQLNRTSFSITLRSLTREPLALDEVQEIEVLDSNINVDYRLTEKIVLNTNVDFRKNKTRYRAKSVGSDLYRRYGLSVAYTLSKHFETSVAYQYVNSTLYSENRGIFELRVKL